MDDGPLAPVRHVQLCDPLALLAQSKNQPLYNTGPIVDSIPIRPRIAVVSLTDLALLETRNARSQEIREIRKK